MPYSGVGESGLDREVSGNVGDACAEVVEAYQADGLGHSDGL